MLQEIWLIENDETRKEDDNVTEESALPIFESTISHTGDRYKTSTPGKVPTNLQNSQSSELNQLKSLDK